MGSAQLIQSPVGLQIASNTPTSSFIPSLPNNGPRIGVMWNCGPSRCTTGQPASASRVLKIARPDRADDLRHHSRFEVVVQDMSHRKRDGSGAVDRGLRHAFVEPFHVERRVTRPALAADFRVEMGIAVGEDVEPEDS
ncbi:MAG: hypothetical protein ACKVQT_32765 [Burkholderiales bacterium]